MKLKTVQSKYSNPDKFIKKLENRLLELRRLARLELEDKIKIVKELNKLKEESYGKFWFSYSDPGHELSVNLTGTTASKELENMKIDTDIICFGKIIGFSCSKNGKNEADMAIKSVYLKRAK